MELVDHLLDIARRISLGETPPYQHNELCTAGAFDQLIVHASGDAAFKLIAEICARFPSERQNSGDLRGYYQLLTQLARQSDTTQMPPGLAEVIAADPNMSSELKAWYRAA